MRYKYLPYIFLTTLISLVALIPYTIGIGNIGHQLLDIVYGFIVFILISVIIQQFGGKDIFPVMKLIIFSIYKNTKKIIKNRFVKIFIFIVLSGTIITLIISHFMGLAEIHGNIISIAYIILLQAWFLGLLICYGIYAYNIIILSPNIGIIYLNNINRLIKNNANNIRIKNMVILFILISICKVLFYEIFCGVTFCGGIFIAFTIPISLGLLILSLIVNIIHHKTKYYLYKTDFIVKILFYLTLLIGLNLSLH